MDDFDLLERAVKLQKENILLKKTIFKLENDVESLTLKNEELTRKLEILQNVATTDNDEIFSPQESQNISQVIDEMVNSEDLKQVVKEMFQSKEDFQRKEKVKTKQPKSSQMIPARPHKLKPL